MRAINANARRGPGAEDRTAPEILADPERPESLGRSRSVASNFRPYHHGAGLGNGSLYRRQQRQHSASSASGGSVEYKDGPGFAELALTASRPPAKRKGSALMRLLPRRDSAGPPAAIDVVEKIEYGTAA